MRNVVGLYLLERYCSPWLGAGWIGSSVSWMYQLRVELLSCHSQELLREVEGVGCDSNATDLLFY